MKNLLLFGLGYHARRIYYPVLLELQAKGKIDKIYIVDLKKQEKVINDYLKEKKASNYDLFLLDNTDNNYISDSTNKHLDKIVSKIGGVIIATDPESHIIYAKWALKNEKSILMDKPVSSEYNISTDIKQAKKLIEDYLDLKKEYLEARKKNNKIIFSVLAQRRFHNMFGMMKEAIEEVKKKTNCPITSYQSFHGDGQWLMPSEIVDRSYHGYNHGYGKCSHSGYHFLDIASWFLNASYVDTKKPDNFDTFSNAMFPKDFLEQITFDDYRDLFEDFDEVNKYTEKELASKWCNYGEIDAFNNFTFKRDNDVMTLASINLCHNNFTKRSWMQPNNKDLYKGNGRVRHESYYISQGPFQSIIFESYQAKEVNPNLTKNVYKLGGEFHLNVFIFRNTSFNPKWKCVQKYTVKDFVPPVMKDKSRGHQEDARRQAILKFVNNIINNDTRISEISDLLQEETSVKMMSGIYQSLANKKAGKNPLINIPI